MGEYDAEGVYMYDEQADQAAPFSDLLNIGQEAQSAQFAADRARLAALELQGAASTWTPTLTNVTVGAAGVVTGYWSRLGDLVAWQWKFVLGADSAITNTVNTSFPTQVLGSSWMYPGGGWVSRGTSATGRTMLGLRMVNGTTAQLWYNGGSIGAASPLAGGTWASGDVISVGGAYFAP